MGLHIKKSLKKIGHKAKKIVKNPIKEVSKGVSKVCKTVGNVARCATNIALAPANAIGNMLLSKGLPINPVNLMNIANLSRNRNMGIIPGGNINSIFLPNMLGSSGIISKTSLIGLNLNQFI